MPEEYLEGRTTDPATWMRTPENLARFAAFEREANASRRAVENHEFPAPAADSAAPHHQEHQRQQPGQGRGIQS